MREREPMAHPRPDPTLPPDSARRDLAAVGLAISVLVTLWLVVTLHPGIPVPPR